MNKQSISITTMYLGKGINNDFNAEMFQVSLGKKDYFVSYRVYNNGKDELHVRKLPIPKREDYNSEDEWMIADSLDANTYFKLGEIVEELIKGL